MPPNFAEGQKRFGAGESRFVSANRRAIFFQPPSPPLWPSSFAGCHRVFGNITRFTSLYYLYRRGRVLTAGTWGKNRKKRGGKKRVRPASRKFPHSIFYISTTNQPASSTRSPNPAGTSADGWREREREREKERWGKKNDNNLRFIMRGIKRIKSDASEKIRTRR